MSRVASVIRGLAPFVIAAPLVAQELPLKRAAPAPIVVACPAFPTPIAPVRAQTDEANRMATLGSEAALEGDHKSARDLFQQAAQLNQVDAGLAYRLGREEEEMGDKPAAIHEYCRYLFLSPAAGDAGQIRDKVAAILPGPDLSRGKTIVDRFRDGVQAYDRSDWGDAVQAFSDVVAAAPGLAPAFYDRALASAHQHHQPAAIRDLDQYLLLTPAAGDSEAVHQRQIALRRELPSATAAFWLGLLPGGGQYYTRQPLLGVLVTGAAAGAVVWGVQTQTVTRTATFTDKNGHPYTQTFPASEHKNLGAGIGVAAGVTLLGAIEAAIVAHNRSGDLPNPTIVAGPRQLGLALGLEFR